jgi:hypothetical protein
MEIKQLEMQLTKSSPQLVLVSIYPQQKRKMLDG